MKRFAIFMFIALSAIITTTTATIFAQERNAGDFLGNVLNTDIRVNINGVPIMGYNINGCTYVVAEDLDAYGFVVDWNPAVRRLDISQGTSTAVPRTVYNINPSRVGSIAFPYVYTDILAFIDGTQVTSYNIQGSTVVLIDDVANLFGMDINWNGSLRTLSVTTPPPPWDIRYVTTSAITLPNRVATDEERQIWIDEYLELGGPSGFELEVVRLINEIRLEHNLALLEVDYSLMMAARFYTQIMSNLNTELGHNEGPYATNPGAYSGASLNVSRAFGGQLSWGGGNGAAGQRTPQRVVDGWMNSDGHRRYILSPEHRYIGVGTTLGGRYTVFHYMYLSERPSR
jgi:uncharacterized protein YkwD